MYFQFIVFTFPFQSLFIASHAQASFRLPQSTQNFPRRLASLSQCPVRDHMSYSARASITQYQRWLGWGEVSLKDRTSLSQFWRLEAPGTGLARSVSGDSSPFLARRRSPCCALAWPLCVLCPTGDWGGLSPPRTGPLLQQPWGGSPQGHCSLCARARLVPGWGWARGFHCQVAQGCIMALPPQGSHSHCHTLPRGHMRSTFTLQGRALRSPPRVKGTCLPPT